MTLPKTLPHTFHELLDQLNLDPTCVRVARLTQHLAARTAKINDPYIPVGLFPHDTHEAIAPTLEQARTHVQSVGLDFTCVLATHVEGILVYVHAQDAEGSEPWAS